MSTTPPNAGERPGAWLAGRFEQPSLSRYLHAVRSHLGLIAAFTAAALFAAFAYVTLAPKTYNAEADLLVTPAAPDDPNLVGLPLVRSTSDPTADVLTVAKLVPSPVVAARVGEQIGGSPSALLGDIQATPVTQSEIIAVDATAGNPERAAALANAFAQQTVAERTAELHAQIASMIPGLQSTLKTLPPSARGAVANQLAVLETLKLGQDPTLRVSSGAQPPTSPSSPRAALSLAAGGFAGLAVGLLAVFVLQTLGSRLRDEEQLRSIYDLPLLARVPRQRAGHTPLAPDQLMAPAAEAFRMLRAAFTTADPIDGRGRAIAVTGDTPAQGKTTVALNLAASLVAAGKQVILIEADLRRPSIGRALGVKARCSALQVLLGQAELLDALIWARPYGPQLELLLAGVNEAEAADRVSPAAGRQLVRDACAIADFVVIDLPPLTDVSDAVPFAEEADDVLLVARIGTSRLRKLTDLGELLGRHAVTPAGLVLVGAEDSRSGGYYAYGSATAARNSALLGLLQRRAGATQNGSAVGQGVNDR